MQGRENLLAQRNIGNEFQEHKTIQHIRYAKEGIRSESFEMNLPSTSWIVIMTFTRLVCTILTRLIRIFQLAFSAKNRTNMRK